MEQKKYYDFINVRGDNEKIKLEEKPVYCRANDKKIINVCDCMLYDIESILIEVTSMVVIDFVNSMGQIAMRKILNSNEGLYINKKGIEHIYTFS